MSLSVALCQVVTFSLLASGGLAWACTNRQIHHCHHWLISLAQATIDYLTMRLHKISLETTCVS